MRILLLCCLCCWLSAAELTKEQARLLGAAQDALQAEEPARARELLADWPGEDLSQRQQLLALSWQASDAAKAEAAWQQAILLDENAKPPRLGLLQLLIDQERWPEAFDTAIDVIDPATAEAAHCRLLAQLALEVDDLPFAAALSQRCLARFPRDHDLRRLRLAILLRQERHQEAGDLLRAMLARNPNDAAAWRDLASLHGDEALGRAALQAAVLANPDDRQLRLAFLGSLLQAGQGDEALRQAQLLVREEGLAEAHLPCVRAALMVGDTALAETWLAAAPEGRERRELALHLALLRGDRDAARSRIGELLAAGNEQPRLLLWAAQLEREAGDDLRAELLLRRLLSNEAAEGDLACLHLAHIHLQRQEADAALKLLQERFGTRPSDAAVRQLQRAAEAMLLSSPPDPEAARE